MMSVARRTGWSLGLLVTLGALSLTGCGGGENDAQSGESQPAEITTQPAETTTQPAETSTQPARSNAGGSGRGRSEGDPRGTYTYDGSARGTVKLPETPEAQLALLQRAKRTERNRAAGCRLLVRGKKRQWGPPPPEVNARLLPGGDVTVDWRYARLSGSLACKPFKVVIGISKGRPGDPNFTSVVFEYRLLSTRGRSRQPTRPYLERPPYKVSVAGESLAEVQGPPVTALVNR